MWPPNVDPAAPGRVLQLPLQSLIADLPIAGFVRAFVFAPAVGVGILRLASSWSLFP